MNFAKSLSKRNFMRFTKSHEWIKLLPNNKALIGITHHASEQLGQTIFVDFLQNDVWVKAKEEIATIESVKAAADVYAPVECKLIQRNDKAVDGINNAPETDGWLWQVEIKDQKEYEDLLSLEEYKNIL